MKLRCARCKRWKPPTSFLIRRSPSNRKRGRQYYCYKCHLAYLSARWHRLQKHLVPGTGL